MCIVPIITVAFVWTNEFHGLIWKQIYLNNNGIVIVKHGLWFWIHAAYSDSLNLISIIITVRFLRFKAPLYGKQFEYLVFSMMFVMIVNAMYVLKIGSDIDMTPIAWGISSLFILRALFMNKLFDLVPIARSTLVENMIDGIVVLDINNRIIDINHKARKIFNCEVIDMLVKGFQNFLTLGMII